MQVASDLEFNDAMIAEREQGIQEVEKAVREVNEIFKDLSLIVSQQGEQVRCLLARLLPRPPTRTSTDRRHRRHSVKCG
jgi:syntaxin 7